jgi:hypothetical protein
MKITVGSSLIASPLKKGIGGEEKGEEESGCGVLVVEAPCGGRSDK